MLKYYSLSYNFYAHDTQIYFKLDSEDQRASKFNSVLNTVLTWMFERKLKLKKEKTNIMVVGNRLEMRNIYLSLNLKLNRTDMNLSTKLRNLGVVFDESFNSQVSICCNKKRLLEVLWILQKHRNLPTESKLKLVHGLYLTHIVFCNALLYWLPNTDLHGLHMTLNAAVRIIVNMSRYSRDRFTPRAIELHFMPVNSRIEYNVCLLGNKSLLSGEPRYIKTLF